MRYYFAASLLLASCAPRGGTPTVAPEAPEVAAEDDDEASAAEPVADAEGTEEPAPNEPPSSAAAEAEAEAAAEVEPVDDGIPTDWPDLTVEVSAVDGILFETVYSQNEDGEEQHFAVPVLCKGRDSTWIGPAASCVRAMESGAQLMADGGTQISIGEAGPVYDRYYWGFPVPNDTPEYTVWWNRGGLWHLPKVDCSPLGAGLDVRPVEAEELDAIGLTSDVAPETRRFFENHMVAESVLEADFDNDGERDRLLAVWPRDIPGYEDDCYTDPYALLGVWGNDEEGPTLVDLTCGLERSWTLSERWGGFMLWATDCFDMNEDGIPELYLATGGDSERSYEFVTFEDRRLVGIGGGTFAGD